MKKKLYIHIGTPKTGTSAIQAFCANNSQALEKMGYCYPMFPYKYPQKAKVRNGLFLSGMIRDNEGNRLKEEERKNFLEGMETVKELFTKYDAVVLSDEGLWYSTIRWRKDLLKELTEIGNEQGFEVVVIVYLRRQDEFLTSHWSQDLKGGFLKASVRTWDEWLEKALDPEGGDCKYPDYKARLDLLSADVGKENLIVRRYDRAGFYGGSIYADFLHIIGLELTEDFVIAESERNPGLKSNTNEISRILNTLPNLTSAEHLFFKNALLGYVDVSAKAYPTEVLSKEERDSILAEYQEGNRAIAKEYFGEDGDLFVVEDTMLPKWEKENPYMIDDVIRLIGMTTLTLRKENELLREELKEVRKKAEQTSFTKIKKRVKKIIKK